MKSENVQLISFEEKKDLYSPVQKIRKFYLLLSKNNIYRKFGYDMNLNIRKAEEKDLDGIMKLLRQVNDVHADGRPDLFIHGCTKYNTEELKTILHTPETPVFVAIDEYDEVTGYCFCVIQEHKGSNNLQPVKTLYIDDLCVDAAQRGRHIGRTLYDYTKDYAKRNDFYNLTLNVWSCNPNAMRFYESIGMKPMKIGMEEIL